MDDDNSLAIHDWFNKRLTVTSPVDKAKVTSVAWKSNTDFMTTGLKHVKFWTLTGKNLKGLMGNTTSPKFDS